MQTQQIILLETPVAQFCQSFRGMFYRSCSRMAGSKLYSFSINGITQRDWAALSFILLCANCVYLGFWISWNVSLRDLDHGWCLLSRFDGPFYCSDTLGLIAQQTAYLTQWNRQEVMRLLQMCSWRVVEWMFLSWALQKASQMFPQPKDDAWHEHCCPFWIIYK